MPHLRTLILLACLAPAAASAGPKKPFVEPGTRPNAGEVAGEPEGARPDDRFADLRLQVDRRGYPTHCSILKTNIPNPETRAQVCGAFMADWHVEPKIEGGVAVPQVVLRHMVLRGKRHR